MRKETTLCMGCMTDKGNDGDCPDCGYAKDSIYLASYLAPSTFLSDRYIIGRLISYNGEGALYIAYDTETETKITIKEYMPETLCTRKKDEEIITVNAEHTALYKTYLSEFVVLNKALMSADGNNLQKVLDVFTLNNTAYAVYEYVDGVSLKTHLANLGGILTWSQVRTLFTPVLKTLKGVHSHGITHRGLSCTTLLVNNDDELVLIGFAITAARTYDSDINFEVFSGYAPPELYCTTARHGSWTDVYGISAVIYKVLTGQTPPDAIERKEYDNLIHPLNLNSGIPKGVSDILIRGLSLDAEDRFQTISEFMDRLLETPENQLEMGLIRKPPVNNEIDPDRRRNRHQPASARRKKNVNSTAVLICVVLVLTILGFVFAIALPAIYPDLLGDDTETTTTPAPPRTTTSATTTVTEPTSQVNATLYTLPNFVDRPFELIQGSATYSYLVITPTYEFNSDYKEGRIIDQDIPPGTEVTSGTELALLVSKGPEKVNLPDFAGLDYEKYAAQLSALNIKFETVAEDNGEVKKDMVIRCSAEVDSEINVAESETVIIYYSTGKSPDGEEGGGDEDDGNDDSE